MTLSDLLAQFISQPSDINEHLEWMSGLAFKCDHITEFGTRDCLSTTAFLLAHPKHLICYDVYASPRLYDLNRLKGETDFKFIQESTLTTDTIKPTDLLFIDTLHNYDQLKAELNRHGNQSKKWILMHDTETYKMHGDPAGTKGLWPAIDEWLQENKHWKLKEARQNNNGMMLLERDQ